MKLTSEDKGLIARGLAQLQERLHERLSAAHQIKGSWGSDKVARLRDEIDACERLKQHYR